jgi:hypothetical protein
MAFSNLGENDDWFDIEKYKQAAGVAYGYAKQKIQDTAAEQRLNIGAEGTEQRLNIGTTGSQQRETIGKEASEQRTSAEQAQRFRQQDEERDYGQSQRAYRY